MPDDEKYVTTGQYNECIKRIDGRLERIDTNIEHIDQSLDALSTAISMKTQANGDQDIMITKLNGRVTSMEETAKRGRSNAIYIWLCLATIIGPALSGLMVKYVF